MGNPKLDANITVESKGEKNQDNSATSKDDGKKIVKTCVLFICFFIFGFCVSPIGPTLANMEVLLKTDTASISMALSANSIGYLVGSCVCAAVFDRLNPELQLCSFFAVVGVSILFAPWSSNVYGFAAFMALTGIGYGYLDSGGNAYLLVMWSGHKAQNPLFQALQVIWSIGTTVAPYTIKPFLVEIPRYEHPHNQRYNQSLDLRQNDSYHQNGSYHMDYINGSDLQLKNEVVDAGRVRYAYILVGATAVFGSVLMLILFATVSPTLTRKKHRPITSETSGLQKVWKGKWWKIMFILMMCMFFFLFSATQHIPAQFTSLFVIEFLGWTVKQGAIIATAFWGAHGLGRVLVVPASYFISPRVLLIISLVLISGGYALMLFMSTFSEVIVYVSIVIGGSAVSTIYANAILWSTEFIKISGFFTGVLTAGFSISGMVMYPFAAYCFTNLGYMWFAYILVFLGAATLFFFMLLELFVKYAMKPVPKEKLLVDEKIIA